MTERHRPSPKGRPLMAVGQGLCLTGLTLALFAQFGGVEPFWIGIWVQAEAPLFWVCAASAVAAAGLVLQAHARPRRFACTLANPLLLCLGALVTWSALTSVLHPAPLASWFGYPELGEGVLSFLCLWVLTGVALGLRGAATPAVALAVGVGALTLAAAVLLLPDRHSYKPLWFPDFLAFPLGAATVVFLAWPGVPAVARGVGAGLGLIAFLATDNTSAMVGVLGVAAALLLARWLPWPGWRWITMNARVLGAAVAVGAMVTVTAGMLWFGHGLFPGDHVLVANLIDRSRLLEIGLSASMEASAQSVVVGQGWHAYADAFTQRLRFAEDRYTVENGLIVLDWTSTRRGQFHSHNQAVQSLLAVGVPGLSLTLLFVAGISLWCRRRFAILGASTAVILAVLWSTWFQMPGTIAFLAVAIAALAGPSPRWSRRVAKALARHRAWLMGSPAVAALLLALGAGSIGWLADRAADSTSRPGAVRLSPEHCERLLTDAGRGGYHLAEALSGLTDQALGASTDGHPLPEDLRRRLTNLRCAAARWMRSRESRYLAASSVVAASALDTLAEHAAVPAPPGGSWREQLLALLDWMPARTDLAIPFLAWHLSQGEDGTVAEVTQAILAHSPNDPIALWYGGLVLLGRPAEADRRAGMAWLARALDNRLDRIIPVDPALIERIRANAPR